MAIQLLVPGASAEDIQRGVDAATVVFERAAVTPEQAARAAFEREGWDMAGFPDDRANFNPAAADAWEEAMEAAFDACLRGAPQPPGCNFIVDVK